MRLIDADELIKTYEKETGYKWNEKCILECPKCFIDNAPTVSFIISPDYVTELQNLNKELTKQLEEVERPQGEWIVDKDNIFENFRKCSNCNEGAEWLDGGSQFLSNFCPNCGAKMVISNE